MPLRKRAILLANTDWYLSNFRRDLASGLMAVGWDVTLASPQGPYARRLREEGFRWVPVHMTRKGISPLSEFGALLGVLRLYRASSPALVHHFTMKPVLYGSLAARWLGVPAVVDSISGLGHLFLSNRPVMRLLRALLLPVFRLALGGPRVRLIFENASDRETFLRLGIGRPDSSSVVAGAGVDLLRFAPAKDPPGEVVVLLPARILWDKGVMEFSEAARIVRRAGSRARFVLVGEPDPGNPSSIDLEVIRAWVREGVLEWWGHRADMPAVYAAAHIVVLPSYGEGLPSVLLEAAACGRAVVASDIPGCRAAVVHGQTGLLVPVGDAPAIAKSILELLNQSEVRTKMGENARRLAEERFDVAKINREILAVYESLLNPAELVPIAPTGAEDSKD